ncbi:MAG: HAD family hydrolase [Methylophilaceae bacterium]|uniref:histidinol-phosphatase n=1 Tax=Methylobacillus sp. MM3 TaxID=1848039 RepID=UPI0007E109B7|nr:HAD family hydrolase [Methylobacillus sp. MM3]OAJ70297.1 phosphoserine phosphatase [Methylobacillus sp. MM3]
MRLALFDLDNTLLAGDSDFEWAEFLISQGVLDRQLHQARNAKFYDDYKNGTLDIHAFLEFQLKPLSQHPRSQLDAWHQKYMEIKVRGMMTDKARALVEKHRQAGDLMMVITATNGFVTAPIAHEFGIENLIATIPEEIDGEFTGRVSGVPSFKEGKVTRLHAWLHEREKGLADFDETWFYSDSLNDLPLLKVVDHPVAVDPDPVLRAYAEEAKWPIISLRN